MERNIPFGTFRVLVFLFFMPSLGGMDPAAGENFDNKSLKGLYAFTMFQSCVADPGGFTNLAHNLGGRGLNAFGISGHIQYHGGGTGTVSRRQLILVDERNNLGVIQLFQADLTCDVSYSVNPDGTFTHAENQCTGKITAGSALFPYMSQDIGKGITQNGIKFMGTIEKREGHLLFSDTNINVETVVFGPNDQGVTFSLERICTRSGSAFRVSKK